MRMIERRGPSVVIRALSLAAVVAGGFPALAAGDTGRAGLRPSDLRISQPSRGAVVFGHQVHVTVRVGSDVRSFRAKLDSTIVTGSFERAGQGRQRIATLRHGTTKGLRFGRNTLRVRTVDSRGRRRFSEVRFVLARRVDGLLAGVSGRPAQDGGATVTVRLARASLRLSVRPDGGPAVRVHAGGRTRVVSLDGDHGLRPGTNVLRVRAVDGVRGMYTQRRVRLLLPRDAPVAAAGPSRRGDLGDAVRLDARNSVPATNTTPLRYRWSIVRAPSGSRARLQDATSRRPLLRPDRPGRYRLRVTVSHASAATSRRGGFAASAAASSSDDVDYSAAISGPPLGIPIDTIAKNSDGAFGVQVGDETTSGASFYAAPDATAALQLVVLDRGTLALVSNTSFANDATGAAALLTTIQALPNTTLAILARPDPSVMNFSAPCASSCPVNPATSINAAMAAIGAGDVPSVLLSDSAGCGGFGQCSAFSVIGVPGTPVGQSHFNPGLAGLPSGVPAGGLHGYLQEDLTGQSYAFVDTQRVPFDTGDPTANPAVMTIGSAETQSPVALRSYTSQTLDGPGFFVLVLDSGSLVVRAKGTFPMTNAGLSDMHTLLDDAERDASTLVFVRSIGVVGRVSSGTGQVGAWDAVAGDLQALGGSSFYFNALDGTPTSSGYAQVAPGRPGGYPNPWTQVASPARSGTTRLSGLLARNTSGQLYPGESLPSALVATSPSDSVSPLAGTLTGLISLPTSAWPMRATVGQQAVLNCIAEYIDPNGKMPTPIESNYDDTHYASLWASWADTITADDYASKLAMHSDCGSFTEQDVDDVTNQLNEEWQAVGPVWDAIGSLKDQLVDSQGNASDVLSAAAAVDEDVAAAPTSGVHYDVASIVSDILWSISGFLPFAAEVAGALNVVAGGLGLASELNVAPDGSSVVNDVSTTAADLAVSLEDTYTSSATLLDQQGSILVSDWTKLQIAGQNALGLGEPAADWTWSAGDMAEAAAVIRLSARRLAYRTLLPARYSLYRLSSTAAAPLDPSSITPYTCEGLLDSYWGTVVTTWQPFATVNAYGGVAPVVSGEGTLEQWAYAGPDTAFLTGQSETATGDFPSQSLLNLMFVAPLSDPVQGSQPLFASPLQFALEAYANATSATINVAHVTETEGLVSSNLICDPSPSQ